MKSPDAPDAAVMLIISVAAVLPFISKSPKRGTARPLYVSDPSAIILLLMLGD